MSGWSIAASPLLPVWAIALFAITAAALLLFGALRRARGTAWRALACMTLAAIALNPSLVNETDVYKRQLEDWRHYPDGDVHDAVSHAQYFYHAHAPEPGGASPPAGAEHGHFHTFMRQGGLSPGAHPLVMPELAIAGNPAAPFEAALSAPAPAGDPDEAWTHLVAIALDDRGRPLRLFTTNRWVTGETWYAAADVAAASARFAICLLYTSRCV